MRKQISTSAIFLLLIAVSLISFGQKGFKVGISMGAILPLGEFKSTNISSNNSGYSDNGVALNFDGDYFLHNRLAVSARFHFGMTSIDEFSMNKRLESDLSNYINENTKSLTDIGYWQWSAPMLGLKYNYPLLTNKIYIEAGAFSGISITQIPVQNMMVVDDTNKQTIYSENYGDRSISIPIMADLAFRYFLSKNMQLKFTSSYFQTKANYLHSTYILKNDALVPEPDIRRTDINVPIQTLNFCLGLIYRIND